MGWLDASIKRGIESGIKASLDKHLDAAIDRALANNPVITFIKAGQMEMLRIDPTMDVRQAWEVSRMALADFLHNERIKFGDERYDWTPDGAVTLVHEMEIDHWESR